MRSRSKAITSEDMLFVTNPKDKKTDIKHRHTRPSFSEVRDYKIAELDESYSSNASEEDCERRWEVREAFKKKPRDSYL